MEMNSGYYQIQATSTILMQILCVMFSFEVYNAEIQLKPIGVCRVTSVAVLMGG